MEDHYSSEEEEVYMGSFAPSEITRRKQLFGDHFTSTPEQLRHVYPTQQNEQSKTKSMLDESDDSVIIINDSNNSNSVITLSDDESFVRHENSFSNTSAKSEDDNVVVKESGPLISISNDCETAEAVKPHKESLSLENQFLSSSNIEKSINESPSNTTGNKYGLNENSVSTSKSFHESGTVHCIESHYRTSYLDNDSSSGNEELSCLHDSAVKNIAIESDIVGSFDISESFNNLCTAGGDNFDLSSSVERNCSSSPKSEDDNVVVKESGPLISISNECETAEAIKPHKESISVENKFLSSSNIEERINESPSNTSGNKYGLNENSVSTSKSFHESGTVHCIESHYRTSYLDINSSSGNEEHSCRHNSAEKNVAKESDIVGSFDISESFNNLCTDGGDNFDLSSSVERNCSSLVEDIDDFVGETNSVDKTPAIVQAKVDHSLLTSSDSQSLNFSTDHLTSDEDYPKRSSFLRTKPLPYEEPCSLQKNIDITHDKTGDIDGKKGSHSFDLSGLTIYDFSLNAVTDSILNISQSSSPPNPLKIHQSKSPVAIQKSNLYEDISCDGEQIDSYTNMSDMNGKMNHEDLHMSVDEIDFRQQGFSDNLIGSCNLADTTNISQPSEYKSCLPSAHSSFKTACGENQSSSEQSSSFHNHRDASDLDISAEDDAVSIKSNQENVDEAGFEILVNNRQNSFNGSPTTKRSEGRNEEEKAKLLSKLPVYQSSKSLLRAPKFYLKPDLLQSSSFKFAKQISQASSVKVPSNIPKPFSPKIKASASSIKQVRPYSPSIKDKKIPSEKEQISTKTITKISSPKFSNSNAKQKIPTPYRNIPTPNKKIPTPTRNIPTPFRSIPTPNPNILVSNRNMPTPKPGSSGTTSKILPSLGYLSVSKTPAKNIEGKVSNKTPAQTTSGIPRAVKSDTKVHRALTPLKYKNTPAKSADKNIPMKNIYKNIVSPIQAYIRGSPPIPLRNAQMISGEEESPDRPTSKSQHNTPVKSLPKKAMQKLKYDSVPQQENVNPNIIDLSRDTIPSKFFEPSLEVFWKQENAEPRLPNMGEKQTKILMAIPEVKIICHEGRVNECPTSKGVLVTNNEISPPDVPESDNLPHEQTNGRISVRIQKTVQLQ